MNLCKVLRTVPRSIASVTYKLHIHYAYNIATIYYS